MGGMGSSGSVGSSLRLERSAVSGALRLCSVIGEFALILAIIPACVKFAKGLEFLLWLWVLRGVWFPGLGVLWLVGGVETTGFGVCWILSGCSGWGGEFSSASELDGFWGGLFLLRTACDV